LALKKLGDDGGAYTAVDGRHGPIAYPLY